MIKLEIVIDESHGIASDLHVSLKVPPTSWEKETAEKIITFGMEFQPEHAEQVKLMKIKYDNPKPFPH